MHRNKTQSTHQNTKYTYRFSEKSLDNTYFTYRAGTDIQYVLIACSNV